MNLPLLYQILSQVSSEIYKKLLSKK